MHLMKSLALAALVGLVTAPAAAEQKWLIEDFTQRPETRWQFISDRVMGGQSTGEVHILQEGVQSFARMWGQVSTANNGGFIQMRLDLPNGAPDEIEGIRLIVRGNDQRYFVHLRTRGTVLPWHYYQVGFDVTGLWTEIRAPLTAFVPTGAFMRRAPQPGSVTSIAIVAYGREHEACIDIREIGFY